MPIGDIVQLVQFLLDAETQSSGFNPVRRGVLAVTHFKGGVGATTIAAGFASIWARHGLSVALVDLDDVNPQLTAWGRVTSAKRELCGQLLVEGRVPKSRINELVHPVEGFDGGLALVGQPEQYQTGFHFKADVIEGAASAAEFIESLIESLRDEFDLVVVDVGRSWGIASFALLPLVQQVLLVLDDDAMSVRRTLECLKRLHAESDDPTEFNLGRWKVVLNGYTGKLLTPTDVGAELEDTGLFPESSELFSLPFSDSGRQWGAPGVSFYDCADEGTKFMMRDIAFRLFPFRQAQAPEGLFSRLKSGMQRLVGS
jgi:cellulose biosynthesis protein BcsQ